MDKYGYMRLAMEQAQKAANEGEVPVGAVIVRNGEVISFGQNHREYGKNALYHAEIEAIDSACKKLGGWRLTDCEMYVTLEPCPMCAGAIINSRIEKLYFGAFDPKAGSVGSVTNLFTMPYNHSPSVESGILKDECAKQLSDFFKNIRTIGIENRKNIQAILIDIDNTILDFRKCAKESITQCFNDCGLEYSDEVFNTFERINNKLWLEIENKTLTIDELREIRWKTVFDELNIASDGREFEWKFIHALNESCEPVEGANYILSYLSDRYILCAASNAPYEQQKNRLEKAGFLKYFTHLFISQDIGYPKPTEAFFDACLKKLGDIKPEQVAIIGDSITADINGGAEFGLYTVWFNYEKLPVPKDIKADQTVNRLKDIKKYF